jgi:hypothetical protein
LEVTFQKHSVLINTGKRLTGSGSEKCGDIQRGSKEIVCKFQEKKLLDYDKG